MQSVADLFFVKTPQLRSLAHEFTIPTARRAKMVNLPSMIASQIESYGDNRHIN